MRGEYDALVTMDRNIEFQQNVSALPFGIVLIRAASNRLSHLVPLVPSLLDALRCERTTTARLQHIAMRTRRPVRVF
jgi:hypothetical protein